MGQETFYTEDNIRWEAKKRTSHKGGSFFMLGYEIRHVYGHVEVYWAGEFLFSADNEGEARRELEAA